MTDNEIEPKKRSWLMWICIGIVLVTYLHLYSPSRSEARNVRTRNSENAGIPVRAVSDIREITVGTGWYDPNTQGLRMHIYGHPKVKGVKWEVRANHDDRTIQLMESIDSTNINNVEFTGNLSCLEYRVAPNQPVQSCPWLFYYDPP